MATRYSNLIVGDGVSQATLPNPRGIASAMRHGAVTRTSIVTLDAHTPSADDTFRLMRLKSSDVLVSWKHYWEAGNAGNTIDVGFAVSGLNHDGAIIDADCVLGTHALGSTEVGNERLGWNSGPPDANYMGTACWEIVNGVTPGTYASDPKEDWDLVLTVVAQAAAFQALTFHVGWIQS